MSSQSTPQRHKPTRFERNSLSVSESAENMLKVIVLLAAWIALGYGLWNYIWW
jgi:hypothetical protein